MAIHSDVSLFWGWIQKPLKVTVNFQQRISKLLSVGEHASKSGEWMGMAGYLRWAVHSRAMAYRVGRCSNKRQKQIEPFTTWGVGTWWKSLLGVFKHHSIHILMIWGKWHAIPFGPEEKVPSARRIMATLPSLMSLLGWCCWILRSQWLQSYRSYSFPDGRYPMW